MDFTLHTYCKLLKAIKEAGYSFVTFEEWCDGKAVGKFVILRHDVDLKPNNSLRIAQLEAEFGIKTSYYFRANSNSNQEEIIQTIVGLGHEIGYHYNELSTFNGNTEKSINHFETQLEYLRQFYPVRTICMHGSPTSKYDNRDLWKKYNYRDYGIIGEPYLDFLISHTSLLTTLQVERMARVGDTVQYFTDTARMWDGDKFNIRDKTLNNYTLAKSNKIHTTFDLINWFETLETSNSIMITSHPQRWTNNGFEWFVELVFQNLKNKIKQLLLKLR
ncbi:MAG: hypothetical protein PHS59_05865 [Paludibacter sp.]|nr:hypothetical protein [Paludibacter sp.]